MKKLLLIIILILLAGTSCFAESLDGTTGGDSTTSANIAANLPDWVVSSNYSGVDPVSLNVELKVSTFNAANNNVGTLPNERLDTGIPATNVGNGDTNDSELSNVNGTTLPIQEQLDARVTIGTDQTITGNKTYGDGTTTNMQVGSGRVTFNVPTIYPIYLSVPTDLPSTHVAEFYISANGTITKYFWDGTTSNEIANN